MKQLVARLNLGLIFILFAGGGYASYTKAPPYANFIDMLLDFISSTITSNYYVGIYYIGLLSLFFSLFVSIYSAFEESATQKSVLLKELEELRTEKSKYEEQAVELTTTADKHLEEINKLKNIEEERSLQESREIEKRRELEAEKTRLTEELSLATSKNKKDKELAEELSKKLEKIVGEKEELLELKRRLEDELGDVRGELSRVNANLKGGREAIPPAAYQIFYLLQKEGRFVDMLHENIDEYDDETLGGAFRKLHADLRGLFDERFILEPVLKEDEGSTVTLDALDTEAIKVSGKVPSEAPYTGELIHKGWRLKECKLPEMLDGWKGDVIAQAEIEI